MSRKKERVNNILPCPEPFIMIPNSLINSPEFNNLNSNSIRLYILLLTRWSRDKERIRKPIIFTYKDLHKITGLSKQTISNSLIQLDTKGYIQITHGGKNNPSKYEITYKHLTK